MTDSAKATIEKTVSFMDHVSEHEVDPSWRKGFSKEYLDYRKEFDLAKSQAYTGKFPIFIELEASYYCNLRCPFCAREANYGDRDIGHMPPELWKKIIDESKEKGLKSINLAHEGESLMNPRIYQMIKEAKDAGVVDIFLHTNANMMTPESSERLIDCGITKINFSIDASTEETYKILRVGGDFKQTIKNVQDFLKIKLEKKASYLRCRVSFVAQQENLHEKKDFFEFWKNQKGVNMITFQRMIDNTSFEKPDEDWDASEQALEDKYSQAEPFHCTQPWSCTVVDIEGNVIPCVQPVREHTKDFILGNLNNGDTIESSVNSPKMKALKSLHKKGEWYKNPMCRVCVKSLRGNDCGISSPTNTLLKS